MGSRIPTQQNNTYHYAIQLGFADPPDPDCRILLVSTIESADRWDEALDMA